MREQEQQQIDLPYYEVVGNPREMGASYGAQLRKEIRAFYELRISSAERYLRDWAEGGRRRRGIDAFFAEGARCYQESLRFDPIGAEEHAALSAAVDLDPARLYAATNMTDVRDVVLLSGEPEQEGCTSVLVPPSELGGGLYGQSWDLNPGDLGFIVAIRRRPSNGLESLSITCAGCLTLMGMNSRGVAVGTTNLKTWRSEVGVGYLSVLHKAIQQGSLAEAVEVFQSAPVAGAHSYWVGSPEGGEEWERAPDVAARRGLEEGAIARSNHCIALKMKEIEGVDVSKSSKARLARASALASQATSVESLKQLFSDRSDGVDSINRYPEDEQGTTTNAVLICEPSAGQLYACRGPADRGRWYRFTF
ncbi:MAG: C45 family peptidase [Myxococcota bacterium]|nr:C45 family peptidase [Myxococcota bacterium]